MDTEEEYYPQWLHRDLLEDLLPWDQAATRSLNDFLSTYTLHDSCWVGIFHNVGRDGSLTLCIRWDSIWLPDGLAKKTPHVADWPLLFIRIEGLKQLSLNNYEDLGGLGRTIGTCEIEEVEGCYLFSVSDVFGGEVLIEFSGVVKFLALNRNREVLLI
jgi:hypothetical protein